MWKALAATALVFSSAAPAQPITSYRSINEAPPKGDADKIVCKREETIGTRLGAKKVCLTVAEWTELARTHRERTEQIQSGSCLVTEGNPCLSPN